MPQEVVVWDDFSGGDEGRTRPPKGKSNTFRGMNVWQYPSGIGPRPPFVGGGVISGLPTGVPLAVAVSEFGTVYMVMGAASPYNVYLVDVGGATATLVGTVLNAPSDWVAAGDGIMFCSTAGPGAVIAAGVPVAVPAMPSGSRIELFNEQMVVMSGTTLRWSAPRDAATWPAANTVLIGATPDHAVREIAYQRGRLIILNRMGEIWAVSGALGTNETYSRVDVASHPVEGNGVNSDRPHGVLTRQAGFWYPVSNRWAVNFTGARAYPVPVPDMASTGFGESSGFEAVSPLLENDSFLAAAIQAPLSGSTRSISVLEHRGATDAWTRHRMPDTISGTGRTVFMSPGSGAQSTVVTIASASTVPRAYEFDADSQFPISLADGQTAAVTADFRTGEMWDPEGSDISVLSVIVDYSFVNGTLVGVAGYGSPTFTVSVESTQPYKDTLVDASSGIVFVPPTTGNPESTEGDYTLISRGRASFQFGDQQPAAGFRIKIGTWRNILIHRITAVIETTPAVY